MTATEHMNSMYAYITEKYHCHIAYITHTTNILNGYIEPTFLPICATTQATVIITSHVTAKCGIYAIYAKYMTNLQQRCIHICATYEVTAISHVTMDNILIG